MTGKKTISEDKHASRVATWCDVEIQPGLFDELEQIAGPLNEAEREAVKEAIELAAEMSASPPTDSADVKATLAAITRIKDDKALTAAWHTCDGTSKAFIDRSLYRMDGPDYIIKAPPRPAKIKAAAWLALQDYPRPTAGRRPKSAPLMLARFVLELCKAKRLSTSISHGATNSPAVLLLHTLMAAADRHAPVDYSAAAKYLQKIRGRISA